MAAHEGERMVQELVYQGLAIGDDREGEGR